MRDLLFSSVLACAIAGLVASSSRGAPDSSKMPLMAGGEITGQPSVPKPGDERPMRDPFAPYDLGDPSTAWPPQDLTAEERAVVDRGRDVGTFSATHDAFGSAGAELAMKAAAAAAARHLGIDDLGAIGVVP